MKHLAFTTQNNNFSGLFSSVAVTQQLGTPVTIPDANLADSMSAKAVIPNLE
jgi:hypothetical protein